MKKSILYTVMFVLSITAVIAQKAKKNFPKIANAVEIRLDNIAFDKDEYLKVYDHNDEVIAYYDRFLNKSGTVMSMKVYDTNMKEVYTLVPVIKLDGFEIHLRNSDKERGLIKIISSQRGFRIDQESNVDYFGYAYQYDIDTNLGFGRVSVTNTLNYAGEVVLARRTTVSIGSGVTQTPFKVREAYLKEFTMDAAIWTLITQLTEELSNEITMRNNTDFTSQMSPVNN